MDYDQSTRQAIAEGPAFVYVEAVCRKCGETFNPTGDEDTRVDDDGETVLYEHYMQFGPNEAGEYETECGGFGPIIGGLVAPRAETRRAKRSGGVVHRTVA